MEEFPSPLSQDTSPDNPVTDNIAERLAALSSEIDTALDEASRPRGSVALTAVSKKQPIEKVRAALDAGHRIFGENRVQEAQQKWPALKSAYPDVELRLIGPLQSNKAADAVALFDVVESVDRLKIAAALAKEIARQQKEISLFAQINTGEESQKSGAAPRDADDFLKACRDQHGLVIRGLMCIPPAGEDPAPHFALLAKIAARNDISLLSMGMSADYAIAAQLGATHVRIGTGVFGPRG